MKRINFLVEVALALGVALGLLGSRMLSQDNLKGGTVLQRTALKSAPGWEAILVQRILPPGAGSGNHTQIRQRDRVYPGGLGDPGGSGQARAGEAFSTVAGEVHKREECQQQRACGGAGVLRCQKRHSYREPLGSG